MIFAMSHSDGVLITILVIVILAVLGFVVITDDMDWFN